MKVAILGEFPSQPAKNTADCIKRFSKHEVILVHRFANLNNLNADVCYYMNILDLVIHPQAKEQVLKGNHKVCTSVRSWRIVKDKGIQQEFLAMQDKLQVVSFTSDQLMQEVQFDRVKMRIRDAPDFSMFKQITEPRLDGKINVGYVGTYRDDKRFNEVLVPIFKELTPIIEPKIYGKAGSIVPHKEMIDAYNGMDVLLLPSKLEGASLPPMEAAACGRMTIGTKCGNMDEIFDSQSAELFPVLDSIPSTISLFKEALFNLYSFRNDARVKGAKAKERILEKRAWSDVIHDYNTMFENTLKGA